MKKVFAVALRELRERWLLFPGALVIGCVPLALPAIGLDRDRSSMVGLLMAQLLGIGAALVAGSSLFARDAEGRLAFLFARPVSWPQVWAGRWIAAFVLVAASVWLAVTPWMTVYPPGGRGSWLEVLTNGPRAVFFELVALGIVLAIGLASFIATVGRSRSPWLVVDLVLLLAVVWLLARPLAPLVALSFHLRQWLFGPPSASLMLPLVLALLVGSAAQIAVGRTDIRRAHRALSIGSWSVVLATLAAGSGWIAWARAATPADLVRFFWVAHSQGAPWVYVEGYTRQGGWYAPAFLIDTRDGRYLSIRPPATPRITSGWLGGTGVSVSVDGRRALRWWGNGAVTKLSLIDLVSSPPVETILPFELGRAPFATPVALAPSLTTMFFAGETMSLLSLPSGDVLATSLRPEAWSVAAIRYLAEGRVRAWLLPFQTNATSELRIVELARGAEPSLATVSTGPWPRGRYARNLAVNAWGNRLLTLDGGLHLRDGATGVLLATLVEGGNVAAADFLTDGRIVAVDLTGYRAALRVFTPEGAPLRQIELGAAAASARLGVEIAPARVVVELGGSAPTGRVVIVDVEARQAPETLEGLRPLGPEFWRADVRSPSGTPASAAYVLDSRGGLVRLDASGERRLLAGPGAPVGSRLATFE